jgi:hypothetical protein
MDGVGLAEGGGLFDPLEQFLVFRLHGESLFLDRFRCRHGFRKTAECSRSFRSASEKVKGRKEEIVRSKVDFWVQADIVAPVLNENEKTRRTQ